MGTKREELVNASGCLGKAHDDEPIFILRAHDLLAPFIVRQWARMYYVLNTTARNISSNPFKPDIRLSVSESVQRKHDEAMRLADAMDKWHDRKLPD